MQLPPDAWLILLFTACTLLAYLAWVVGILPRLRVLLAALAIALLVATLVAHDVEVANDVSNTPPLPDAGQDDGDSS